MAQHPERFAQRVIAELRGVADSAGRSPFWDGLGRHFFSMDFSRADALSAADTRAFIAELMPKHPVYAVLLGAQARAVIGEVHELTLPARQMLEAEGFRYRGYVDIFDAGPVLEAERLQIGSLRDAVQLPVALRTPAAGAPTGLIASAGLGDFRCLLTHARIAEGVLGISAEVAAALGISAGHTVHWLALAAHRQT